MKKIIVPTDFSQNSKNALEYALDLVTAIGREDTEIELVHFYNGLLHTDHPIFIKEGVPIKLAVEKELELLLQSTRINQEEVSSLNITTVCASGLPAQELIELSKAPNVELIIMGTSGEEKRNLERQLFGSVATRTAKDSYCPVLLVPPSAGFRAFSNVLVAVGQSAPEFEDTQILKLLTEGNAVQYHFVNVYEEESKGFIPALQLIESHLNLELPKSRNAVLRQVAAPTVSEGIKNYSKETHADLVVITEKKRKLFDRFVHECEAKSIILRAELPILVLHDS